MRLDRAVSKLYPWRRSPWSTHFHKWSLALCPRPRHQKRSLSRLDSRIWGGMFSKCSPILQSRHCLCPIACWVSRNSPLCTLLTHSSSSAYSSARLKLVRGAGTVFSLQVLCCCQDRLERLRQPENSKKTLQSTTLQLYQDSCFSGDAASSAAQSLSLAPLRSARVRNLSLNAWPVILAKDKRGL